MIFGGRVVSIGVSFVCVVQNINLALATTSLGRNSNVIDTVLEREQELAYRPPACSLRVLPPL